MMVRTSRQGARKKKAKRRQQDSSGYERMFSRMQAKLVVAVAASLTVVLGAIGVATYCNSYSDLCTRADAILHVIADNGGAMPQRQAQTQTDSAVSIGNVVDDGIDGTDESDSQNEMFDGVWFDELYETRWFTVYVSEDGVQLVANVDNIVSVSTNEATADAMQAMSAKRDIGFVGKLRYLREHHNDGSMTIVFLDRGRQIDSLNDVTSHLIMYGVMCIVIVSAIVSITSGTILMPLFESYRKQRQFITDAGHDIKTPLTIIRADAELLEYDVPGSEWTADIIKQVQALTGLTDDLIMMSKIDANGYDDVPNVEYNMSKQLSDAIASFESRAKGDGKAIVTNITDGITQYGKQRNFERLCMILIDNALKYSTDGSTVHVSLSQKGGKARLTVTNDANPDTLHDTDRWFDRFYQADSARGSNRHGFGIGLSVARSLVVQTGGRIRALTPDEGTLTIDVEMPLRRERQRHQLAMRRRKDDADGK